MNEQITSQITESMQSMFDLTSRVDERVKSMASNHTRLEGKLDCLTVDMQKLAERIHTVEAEHRNLQDVAKKMNEAEIKLASLDILANRAESRWQKTLHIIVEIAVLVAAGYIMFKNGWGGGSPPGLLP